MAFTKKLHRAPVHPGQVLKGLFEDEGLTPNAAAMRMRIPANRLTEILRGNRGISHETALRLGQLFGTGPDMWATMQNNWDLDQIEKRLKAKIAVEVTALRKTA